jgi:hypothetical protein
MFKLQSNWNIVVVFQVNTKRYKVCSRNVLQCFSSKMLFFNFQIIFLISNFSQKTCDLVFQSTYPKIPKIPQILPAEVIWSKVKGRKNWSLNDFIYKIELGQPILYIKVCTLFSKNMLLSLLRFLSHPFYSSL